MEGNKKQQIIQAAIQCFSEKGFRGTSIQDIADVLGIAKGSLYFYFKSKSDLLYSIMKDYMDNIMAEYKELHTRSDLSPRDLLARHVMMGYNMYEKNKSFFSMLMRERFEINEEIQELVIGSRRHGLHMTHELICRNYGEEIRPYARDLTVVFHSMIEGYLGITVFEQKMFEAERLSSYLLKRLDALAADVLLRGADTILGAEVLEEWGAYDKQSKCAKSELLTDIKAIRETVAAYVAEPEALEEVHATLEVLYSELEKTQPQLVVVKGMLALLTAVKSPELRKRMLKLESAIYDMLA